jgi:hypothetical protein
MFMSSSALKILALLSMTIDHIGLFLVTSPEWQAIFRAFGRIAMPVCCFLVAQGYLHTSSRTRYFFRLFGFAILLECGLYLYYLYSGDNYLFSINIFLTLSAGLGCLILIKSNNFLLAVLGFMLAVAVSYTDFDYGLYGIAMILLFGMTNAFWVYTLGLTMINIFFIHTLPAISIDRTQFLSSQWFSMFSLAGIFLYNGRPGKQNKTFFYLYYPLHILIILTIRGFLQ